MSRESSTDPIASFVDDDDPSTGLLRPDSALAGTLPLLDFGTVPEMTEEENLSLTLEETTFTLQLDSGSEPGVTEDDAISSPPQAAKRNKQKIAAVAKLPRNDIFIFFIQATCLRVTP